MKAEKLLISALALVTVLSSTSCRQIRRSAKDAQAARKPLEAQPISTYAREDQQLESVLFFSWPEGATPETKANVIEISRKLDESAARMIAYRDDERTLADREKPLLRLAELDASLADSVDEIDAEIKALTDSIEKDQKLADAPETPISQKRLIQGRIRASKAKLSTLSERRSGRKALETERQALLDAHPHAIDERESVTRRKNEVSAAKADEVIANSDLLDQLEKVLQTPIKSLSDAKLKVSFPSGDPSGGGKVSVSLVDWIYDGTRQTFSSEPVEGHLATITGPQNGLPRYTELGGKLEFSILGVYSFNVSRVRCGAVGTICYSGEMNEVDASGNILKRGIAKFVDKKN